MIISDSDRFSPSITPDGSKLVYEKTDGIYIANNDGTGSVKLSNVGSSPSISPDGSKIAFTNYSSETMDNEIFIMNIDGSSVSNITGQMSTASSHNHNIYPTWSPDGKFIVFHSDNVADPSTSGDIWKAEVNVGSETIGNLVGNNVRLQVGSNANQNFDVGLTDARTSALGIDILNVGNHINAGKSIEIVDKAIQMVSAEQAKYGAYQNALDYINNNVTNYMENLTSAESRIRDVDMAKEMMNQTRNSILAQAAQANQQPQSVLQLLR